MKKIILILLLLVSVPVLIHSQDIIFKSNGKKISCKVLEINESMVCCVKGQSTFRYYLKRDEVCEIQYDQGSYAFNSIASEPGARNFKVQEAKGTDDLTTSGERSSFTIGLLEGGGSLIGFDYEIMVGRNAGLQAGAGFVGFGGGLNVHFKPTIRSSYLSLQYWHQGFRDSYTQSLVGPSLVFRANKIFTCQAGLGFVLEKGPAWPETITQPGVMLTYAIGLYFPY